MAFINIGMGAMRKNRIDGITYLEVLVVLMIILALTSLLTFKFSNVYDAEEVNRASETLFSDCFFARALALAKNETIFLKKENNYTYKITDQKGTLIKRVQFSNTLTLLGKDSESLIFFKNGTTLGNTFKITKSKCKKYVVVSLLGRVRISDNETF